jgi:hypothetical protein
MTDMLDEKGFEPYCRMKSDMIYVRKGLRKKIMA